jgi:Ion channel
VKGPFGNASSAVKGRLDWILSEVRFATLWITFILLMVLFPFVHGTAGSVLFSILFSVLLIASITTVSKGKGQLIIGLFLVSIALVTRWSFLLLGGTFLDAVSLLFASLTTAFVAFLLFISLFKIKEVTTDTLWEAISIYLLLGLTWAFVFAFVSVVTPGSFKDSVFPDEALTFPALVYYSFVTLATLGYGDILPVTQESRGLAILEVLMGVLYMAILISRLVGAWKPSEGEKK